MKIRISLCLLIFVIFTSIFMTGCPDYVPITFENQTSRPIQADIWNVSLDYSDTPKITWDPNYENSIDVGQSKKFGSKIPTERVTRTKFVVAAVNDLNQVVFSKIYKWDELKDLNWTIVIKPE
jgi:hypothetical protein